eukprot:scaffold253017_cov28-Tisochrysis_lutea.AAC.1
MRKGAAIGGSISRTNRHRTRGMERLEWGRGERDRPTEERKGTNLPISKVQTTIFRLPPRWDCPLSFFRG